MDGKPFKLEGFAKDLQQAIDADAVFVIAIKKVCNWRGKYFSTIAWATNKTRLQELRDELGVEALDYIKEQFVETINKIKNGETD